MSIMAECPATVSLHRRKTFTHPIGGQWLLLGLDRVRCRFPSGIASHQRLLAMYGEDNFSDHVTFGEPLVRLAGLGEGIAFRDWNFEPCGLHRLVQVLEFANSGDAVITDQFYAAPLLRCWLDPVRVREAATGPEHVQT